MQSMSDAIPAANDLNIQMDADSWRLVSTELETPTTLVEATPEGLIVHPLFAEARYLPGVSLSPGQVMRIVLGWAPENRAWRLGLLLSETNATKVDTTQMQWCELAAWPDDVYNGQVNGARMAGQSLARLLNRPFQFLPPNTESRVAAFANSDVAAEGDVEMTFDQNAPSLPVISLAPPPLRFNNWRLILTSGGGVRWQRLRNWSLTHLARILFFGVLFVLFLILGVGTRTTDMAAVEPTWLPLVGLAVSVLMLALLLFTAWNLLGASAVTVDSSKREVFEKGLLIPLVNWRVPFTEVDFVLITQTPAQRKSRLKPSGEVRIKHPEIWLHIYDGERFFQLVHLRDVEGKSWNWDQVREHSQHSDRYPLKLAEYDTPAHHAALQIAERLQVPVYIDIES